MGVAPGRNAGADVEELADANLARQVPDRGTFSSRAPPCRQTGKASPCPPTWRLSAK
jgi:hypothetical protein